MTEKLKVIEYVDTHFNDADDIPMGSWREDKKIPCYYIGAWEDGLDFLGQNHELVEDQRENPNRMFFVFNAIPDSLKDIEKAIAEWANELYEPVR